jgi:hypothetical protein
MNQTFRILSSQNLCVPCRHGICVSLSASATHQFSHNAEVGLCVFNANIKFPETSFQVRLVIYIYIYIYIYTHTHTQNLEQVYCIHRFPSWRNSCLNSISGAKQNKNTLTELNSRVCHTLEWAQARVISAVMYEWIKSRKAPSPGKYLICKKLHCHRPVNSNSKWSLHALVHACSLEATRKSTWLPYG